MSAPPSLGKTPARHSKSVVLPAPFGPIKPRTSPRRTLKLTFCSTARAPNFLERPLTVSRFIMGRSVSTANDSERRSINRLTDRTTLATARGADSKDEPRLRLEHPRRVDVCERRERVKRRPSGRQLAERREWRPRVAVYSLSAAEIVPVIEDIEPFQPELDGRA